MIVSSFIELEEAPENGWAEIAERRKREMVLQHQLLTSVTIKLKLIKLSKVTQY